MNGLHLKLPPFPERFFLLDSPSKVRTVLRLEAEEVVVATDPSYLEAAILRYCATDLAGWEAYQLLPRHAADVAKLWTAETRPIDRPPPVRWQGESGLTFRRLPWALGAPSSLEAVPTFEELFSRCSNALPLIKWIGSLFVPGSDRQQYVWLHGKGMNGKSALARFLARALGPAAASRHVPSHHGDKFWTSSLLDKRFVYFADCNKYGFPSTGDFKQLTGDDMIPIEPKGRAAYDASLVAKFMFLSNEKPSLSSEDADMRRVIYCELEHIGRKADPAYEGRLWEEGGAFLSLAMSLYLHDHPNLGAIEADLTEITNIVEGLEEDFEAYFQDNFAVAPEPKASCGVYSDAEKLSWVAPTDFQQRIERRFKTRADKIAFTAWLDRVHKVKRGIAWTGIQAGRIRQSNRRYLRLLMKPDPAFNAVSGK